MGMQTGLVGVLEYGYARKRYAVAEYDFAVLGGAQVAHDLRGDRLPIGAVVTDCAMRVVTVPTSGAAAELAVNIEGANDVQTVVVIAGAPWSTTGWKRGSALTAAAAPVVTTAERTIKATVSVADLTAGVIRVYVEYFMP